jgi:hypothetical protein
VGSMGVMSKYSYPYLTHRSPSGGETLDEKLAPELLMPSVRPRNPLGAMYTQFYWLLASGGDLSRCKHCGRKDFLGVQACMRQTEP